MEQAGWDLKAAAVLKSNGFHEWACYACQQAAEKAIKSARTLLATHIDTIKVHVLANLIGHLPLLSPGGWDPQFLAGLETLTGHNEGARYPGHRGREPHKPPHELYEATQSDEAIATAARTLDYCKKPEHLLVQGPPRSLNTASSFLSWLPPTRRHPGRVGRTTYIHLFTFRIAASLNQVPGTTTAVSHLPDEQVKPVSQVPFEKHWHVSLPAGQSGLLAQPALTARAVPKINAETIFIRTTVSLIAICPLSSSRVVVSTVRRDLA